MKMRDPFELIQQKRPPKQVLQEAAQITEYEMELAVGKLADGQLPALVEWGRQWAHAAGVQNAVFLGGVLYIVRAATDHKGRSETYRNLCVELEISSTREHDAIAIFRCFGNDLLENPDLMQHFCVESLKRLSTRKTPLTARQTALKDARRGKYISIARADELLGKDSPSGQAPPDIEQGSLRPAARALTVVDRLPPSALDKPWSFSGVAVQIVIEFAHSEAALDRRLVAKELKSALAQFRRERLRSDTLQDDPARDERAQDDTEAA